MLTWFFLSSNISLSLILKNKHYQNFWHPYLDYTKNVPRLFPRLFRWKSDDNRQPMTLLKTLRSEKRTLQNIVIFL
ncbi:MAG: hypothetical protein CM1200mP10_05470 [Candidatus Neomarinimicrobiota bacterium]|nr:MAG: hypothetical protein CM1200mP10_05470 [Candidatus Neomarinimicrobiota bacterium]